jgi:hypothetical protein
MENMGRVGIWPQKPEAGVLALFKLRVADSAHQVRNHAHQLNVKKYTAKM